MRLAWAERPGRAAYRGAREQLALLVPVSAAIEAVSVLRCEPRRIEAAPARILLAARVPVLPASDGAVRRVLAAAHGGAELDPVLLVRHRLLGLVVADGYDRLCAAHHTREHDPVPCRIATMEEAC